jgi:hypothetical protein
MRLGWGLLVGQVLLGDRSPAGVRTDNYALMVWVDRAAPRGIRAGVESAVSLR